MAILEPSTIREGDVGRELGRARFGGEWWGAERRSEGVEEGPAVRLLGLEKCPGLACNEGSVMEPLR